MLDADEKHFKEHGEPLFSSHMIDLSEEVSDFGSIIAPCRMLVGFRSKYATLTPKKEVSYNIETTAKYLKRAAPMKQWYVISDYFFPLLYWRHTPTRRLSQATTFLDS